MIKYYIEEFRVIGVEEGSLGGHPCRKGAVALVLSECKVLPRMSSICLQAFCSMGPVKDYFIHYEKLGDQFVVFVGTGISSLMEYFSTYPCYFDYTCAPIVPKQKINAIIDKNLFRR